VAALTVLLVQVAPAAAQWGGPFYNAPFGPAPFWDRGPIVEERERILPPRAILRILEDRGFFDVDRPRFDGENYIVEAMSPRGFRVRLLVDPLDGEVLRRSRLADLRPPRGFGPPGFERGIPEADDIDEAPLPGRRSVEPPRQREALRDDPPLVIPADPRREQPRPQPRPEARRSVPDRIEGVNPEARAPAPEPRPPAAAKPVPSAPPPAVAKPAKPQPAPKPTDQAKAPEAAGPKGPVRVIEGVTPLNPNAGAPPTRAPEPKAPASDVPPPALLE
jgi:hypothetical protein